MIPDFLSAAFQPSAWPTFVFLTARLSGLVLIAPLWSMTALPRRARAALLMLLACLLLPHAPRVEMPASVLELPVPLAMEMVLGLTIGLAAAVIVQGAALAGEVISLQMGLSLGPALAPMPDLEQSGVAQLQSLLAILIYVAVDGHLQLLRALADSLIAFPPGAPLALEGGGEGAVRMVGALFSGAVRAGAPVIVALLVSNVALAILSRAVPQLNAMMVAFPLTIGVGLIVLGASLPFMAGGLATWAGALSGTVTHALGAFTPAGP